MTPATVAPSSLLLIVVISLLPFSLSALQPPPSLCTCSADSAASQALIFPAVGQPGTIRLAENSTQCLVASKQAGDITCDGICLTFAPCASTEAPPARVLIRPKANATGFYTIFNADNASLCLDFNMAVSYTQWYTCLGDPNQSYRLQTDGDGDRDSGDGSVTRGAWGAAQGGAPAPNRLVVGFNDDNDCITLRTAPCMNAFCPRYHAIQSPGLYDPSGPLQTADGVWHMWEDKGAWTHYTSRDLLHWASTNPPTTGFDGLTGSIASTPEGIYAFWPASNQTGIFSAQAADVPDLNLWHSRQNMSITVPSYVPSGNFRDPLRALQLPPDNAWYVGVGCSFRGQSAELCLFRAADATLAAFTDVGPLLSVNETFGTKTTSAVWSPANVKATMLECPDLFALGNGHTNGTYMVVGSLFSTNQWWTGTIAGSPPRLTPAAVGLVDYGAYYAAKTGATANVSPEPTTRRLMFGFTGWQEPTARASCGRAMLLPRDVRLSDVDGMTPLFSPLEELATLRVASSHVGPLGPQQGNVSASVLPRGAQVELHARCDLATAQPLPGSGVVAFRTLCSADGSNYTEVGYDFASGQLYTDQRRCCGSNTDTVQVAPLVPDRILNLSGGQLNLTVLVDGGLLESFLSSQVVLSTQVNPAGNADNARGTAFINTAPYGLACEVEAWALNSVDIVHP